MILLISGCASNVKNIDSDISLSDSDTYLGYLVIPDIDMYYGFYSYDHKLNDISYNIMNIDTGISDTYLFVAHSGSGHLAYFNDLRYVSVGDEVILKFKNGNKYYKVVEIRREEKTGKLNISKRSGYVYLSTCDQVIKGYQLTIVGELVE